MKYLTAAAVVAILLVTAFQEHKLKYLVFSVVTLVVGAIIGMKSAEKAVAKREERQSPVYRIDPEPRKLLCVFVIPEHRQLLYQTFDARRKQYYATGLETRVIGDDVEAVYSEKTGEWIVRADTSSWIIARFIEVEDGEKG